MPRPLHPGEPPNIQLIERQLPGLRVRSVVALGAGLDHDVYAVNDDLVVRFERHPDPGHVDRLRHEHRLLRFLTGSSPIPVPQPVLCLPEAGVLAWQRLPGEPMINLAAVQRSELAAPVAAELGTLLAALHSLPLDHPLVQEAAVDDSTSSTLLDEARRLYPQTREHLQLDYRDAFEAFLSAPPPAPPPQLVLSHNDLGIEHVLVDPSTGQVSGVIDWADAAIVDPARDFGLILRDLGPDAVQAALAGYGSHSPDIGRLVERASFHARCGVIEDLAYGITTGLSPYLEKSYTSLNWLFASDPQALSPLRR